jgi:hypothetical protein
MLMKLLQMMYLLISCCCAAVADERDGVQSAEVLARPSPPVFALTFVCLALGGRYSGATERDARCYWIPVHPCVQFAAARMLTWLQAQQGQHDSRGTDAFVSSDMFWSFAHGFAAPAGGVVGADSEVEVEAEHLGDAVHQDGVYTE